MRKAAMVLMVAIPLALSGCGHLDKLVDPAMDAETKDIRTIRTAGCKMLKNWPTASGLIRGALGKLVDLPALAILSEVMGELDYLAGVTLEKEDGHIKSAVAKIKCSDLNDFERGYAFGLRLQAAWPIIEIALEQFAPKVLPQVISILGVS